MKIYRSRLILLFCLFGAVAWPSTVLTADNLFQYWVAHYDSPGSLSDIAWDLEIDADRNVYVTGTSDWSGIAIIKYDSERNILWQHFIEDDVQPFTMSFIELDGMGNVYVAYTEVDEGTFPCINMDCINVVIRKYGQNGTFLWENKFGPNLEGIVSDLEVDNAGNVYVARRWRGIIKCDTSGTEQWVAYMTYDISDIAFDSVGNICVTGSVSTGPGETKVHTSKWTPTGDLIWYDPAWDNPGDVDLGLAVTADSEEVVYVAGVSISGLDNIIKYGTELYCPLGFDECRNEPDWTARFGTNVPWEMANSIAVDVDGNVYVSGSSRLTETSFYDCLTAKYDSTGTKLWEARYDGPSSNEDLGAGLVLDDDGNAYVTCQSKGGDPLSHDYATIKYDTDGTQLWVGRYNGPANGEDRSQDIEIDDDGNVYVTGNSLTGSGVDFATIKYTELTTTTSIDSLILTIEDMELDYDIENSLVSKLNNTLKLLDKSRENAAVNNLQAFINQVEAIRGKKLTDAKADALIDKANETINLIQQG